jgi:hypothetical protein
MEIMWPVGAFADAVFAKGLAKGVLNELNVEDLANQIRAKEETTIFDLSVNTNFINENFLSESPFKLVEGRIHSFRARFPKLFIKDKIEIVVSDVFLILVPSTKIFQKPTPEVVTATKAAGANVYKFLLRFLEGLSIRQ